MYIHPLNSYRVSQYLKPMQHAAHSCILLSAYTSAHTHMHTKQIHCHCQQVLPTVAFSFIKLAALWRMRRCNFT